MTPKNERHCKDCFHALVRLKTPNTVRARLESTATVFDNSRVEEISCALNLWEKNFTSMAVFEASDLPRIAAERCGFYLEEDEEEENADNDQATVSM
jgi:hypothetical protein